MPDKLHVSHWVLSHVPESYLQFVKSGIVAACEHFTNALFELPKLNDA